MQAEASWVKYRSSKKKLDCINQVYLVDLVAIDSVDFTTKASFKMGDNVHEYCKLHWSKFKLKV